MRIVLTSVLISLHSIALSGCKREKSDDEVAEPTSDSRSSIPSVHQPGVATQGTPQEEEAYKNDIQRELWDASQAFGDEIEAANLDPDLLQRALDDSIENLMNNKYPYHKQETKELFDNIKKGFSQPNTGESGLGSLDHFGSIDNLKKSKYKDPRRKTNEILDDLKKAASGMRPPMSPYQGPLGRDTDKAPGVQEFEKKTPQNPTVQESGEGGITERMVQDTQEFSRKVEQCELAERPESVADGQCDPRDGVGISNRYYRKGQELGEGAFGKAYDIPDANLVLKVIKDRRRDLCREKIGLEILDGLDGFAPKIAKITSGIDDECSNKVIALEKLGDDNWGNVVKSYDKAFYRRMARLFTAVRALHNRGFIHHDLKGDNIRVRKDDSSFVALIDLGILYSYVDSYSKQISQFFSRNVDTKAIYRMVSGLCAPWVVSGVCTPCPDWMADFKKDMDDLGKFEQPKYEKWIEYFTNLAQ